ncbi:MAG: preprotein translocase subunit SecY [Ruminococcaceae bacterium]|nr:preprotein translocase subunit SecY [Oscillospiraceae bacterium]
MLTTIRNAWRTPELRKKILFTLLALLIFRIGNAVTVPFVNSDALQSFFDASLATTALGFYNTLSGSAFSQATILALSIQPYINASIIIQLLTVAIPALERMSKEGGEEGKKMIERITRYTTVGLGLLMGIAYTVMLHNYSLEYGILDEGLNFLHYAVIVLTFTAGSALVMWLGEQITQYGIGNGISIILFANIISRLPVTLINMPSQIATGAMAWWALLIVVLVMAALVLLIIFVNAAERRIPIQYAKRVVGRKVYGGQNTNLPIKVNMSGVMPVIFAQSIASLPATIFAFTSVEKGKGFMGVVRQLLDTDSWFYVLIYAVMIFGFAYFYAAIQYDPVEISNNLKKNGGFIPGFRPGKPTADFIKKVISKITVFGAVYLAIVCLMPLIGGLLLPGVANLGIGGTSVIIVVGVALETVQSLEAQMLMRHYKGFLE